MSASVQGAKSPAEIKAEELRAQMISYAQRMSNSSDSQDPLRIDIQGVHLSKSSPPSRDRVSAAIALVRARQAARTSSSQANENLDVESPNSGSMRAVSPEVVAEKKAGKFTFARSPLSSPKGAEKSEHESQSFTNSISSTAEKKGGKIPLARSPMSSTKATEKKTDLESPRIGKVSFPRSLTSSPRGTDKSDPDSTKRKSIEASIVAKKLAAKASFPRSPVSSPKGTDKRNLESPTLASRASILGAVAASERKTGKVSFAGTPVSSPKGNSPANSPKSKGFQMASIARKVDTELPAQSTSFSPKGNPVVSQLVDKEQCISPQMARSPLSPKSQESHLSPLPMEKLVVNVLNDDATLPSKIIPMQPSTGSADYKASKPNISRHLAIPALTSHPDENNDQENCPEDDRHESETHLSVNSDPTNSSRVTPTPIVISSFVSSETHSTSNDSDEYTLDTQMLDDVGRFIDAVHNKQSADFPVIPVQQEKKAFSAQNRIPHPTSSDSTDEEYNPVSKATLDGIAQYIDDLAKPRESVMESSENCSSDGDDVPLETKDGIGAFIDALHNKKSPSGEEDMEYTMYLSSSEDSTIDRLSMPSVDTCSLRRSAEMDPSIDDHDLRILEEVLSDRVEPKREETSNTQENKSSFVLASVNEGSGVLDVSVVLSSSEQDAIYGHEIDLTNHSIVSNASHLHTSSCDIPFDENSSCHQVSPAQSSSSTVGTVDSDEALDDAVNAALLGEIGSTFSDVEVQIESRTEKEETPLFSSDELGVAVFTTSPSLEPKIEAQTASSYPGDEPCAKDEFCENELSEIGASREGEPSFGIMETEVTIVTEESNNVHDWYAIDDDAVELVHAFLGVASTTSRKTEEINDQSLDVPLVAMEELVIQHQASNDCAIVVDSTPPVESGPLDHVDDEEGVHFDNETEKCGEKASDETSVDEEAVELLNVFLNGPLEPDAVSDACQASSQSSTTFAGGLATNHGAIEDFIEELVPIIGENEAAAFVKLAWGASIEKIPKIEAFVKAAIPILSAKAAPMVAEAQMRSAAFRVGLPSADLEQVIDHLFGKYSPKIAETLSADSSDLNILHDSKFDSIEEIDESANISAFLSRMIALKAGGHFGEVDSADVAADEAVEVDLGMGFVNRKLEPTLTDEDLWWNGEVYNAKTSSTQTPAYVIAHDRSSETPSQRLEIDRSDSSSPRKSRIVMPRSPRANTDPELVRTIHNQMAQISSQQRLESARSLLMTSLSIDDVQPSLSLTNVPSLIGEIETMLEAREKSMKRSKNAKQSKWVSPWEKRWKLSRLHRNLSDPIPVVNFEASKKAPRLEGVAAACKLSVWRSRPARCERRIPIPPQWKLAYKERTRGHPGFCKVDVYSLYEASIVVAAKHRFDDEPWECRDVKQRFLHEQSISMSRNWFGALLRKRGNDRYREPVAHPKSMEMPMENLPGEGEWLEEWYTTWQQRYNETKKRGNRGDDESDSGSEDTDGSETYNSYTVYTEGDETTRYDDDTATYNRSVYTGVTGSVYTSRRSQRSRNTRRSHRGEDDEESWEEPPECGTFQNVRQKIGERMSLVHHEYLSSLRQSRWRKRYFPRGTFPYK